MTGRHCSDVATALALRRFHAPPSLPLSRFTPFQYEEKKKELVILPFRFPFLFYFSREGLDWKLDEKMRVFWGYEENSDG